jgi:hypothetical protein
VVRLGDADILSRLQNIVGKHGLMPIAQVGEVAFTFLAVHPAPNPPPKGNDEELQHAITRSEFTVQFDEGVPITAATAKLFWGGTYPSSGEGIRRHPRGNRRFG